jgi:hypothetical protein
MYSADEIVALDTGLGFERSERLVIIRVVSRRRTSAQKHASIRCLPTTCPGTAA